MNPTKARLCLPAVVVVALLGVAACSSASEPGGGSSTSVARDTRSATATVQPEATTLPDPSSEAVPAGPIRIQPPVSHVHGAVVDGPDLIVGTHHGLYRVSLTTGASELIGTAEADFMGLARDESGRLFASGHPGPGLGETDPLGLVMSVDEGATWKTMSLAGEVDFHALASRGDEVVGWDTSGPLRWSRDGGRTWSNGPSIAPTTIAWFGDRVWLATPESGLMTWRPGEPAVDPTGLQSVGVAAAQDGTAIWRIDSDGAVYRSQDGVGWESAGTILAAEGFAADRDRAYVDTATTVEVLAVKG